MKQKIVVGMSGGVDSSVTAALLVEQGYEPLGVYIEAYNEPGCRADQDKKDALKVATQLGIRFETIDVRKEYKRRVVEYFLEEYREGRTPNPDIVCNSEIKFGLFLDLMIERGYERVATGHYARITKEGFLQQPRDLSKDQSYFLYRVGRERFEKVMFPLGEMKKEEVRAKARELGLVNANKPDSMGVCMMGELDIREWLRERLGEKEGEVVWRGKPIGRHQGLWFFTIGQRGGWERRGQVTGEKGASLAPLYVIDKQVESNCLVVGEREECCVDKLEISGCKWQINSDKVEGMRVRIRNLGEMHQVVSIKDQASKIVVETKEKIFAPAPGQSAVFYDERGRVVGGGVIY